MASGGGGCSASERLPPPFPGMDPESEGAAGGSEPEAGDSDTEGEDIFTGAAAASKPQSPKKTTSLFPIKNGSKENGIHEEQDQEPQDLFADATVELSLDSTQNNQKTMPGKTLISHPTQEATNSPKPQPSYEELEEEEQEDQFDLTVGITDPEKIGKCPGTLMSSHLGSGSPQS